jgi:hypothetical protein
MKKPNVPKGRIRKIKERQRQPHGYRFCHSAWQLLLKKISRSIKGLQNNYIGA